jgi:hypothetical protein
MKNLFSLTSIFAAVDAWEVHQRSYLASLENAHAPTPAPEVVKMYQRTWIEGYLNARADTEDQPE